MITTTEIAPSPALAPFIRCYCHHEMDTKGLDVVKPLHAYNEMLMEFDFKDKPVHFINPNTGQFIKASYAYVLGLGNQYNGEVTYNGCYSLLTIIFRPAGFNKLFRVPMGEITNLCFYSDDVLDKRHKILFEQLCEAKGLSEMASWRIRIFYTI